jgi:hypothetical protein
MVERLGWTKSKETLRMLVMVIGVIVEGSDVPSSRKKNQLGECTRPARYLGLPVLPNID